MHLKVLELKHFELLQLCDAIEASTGNRFHEYAKDSLKRRFERFIHLKREGFSSIYKQLTVDKNFAKEMIAEITVNVTEMFRNPEFFQKLQEIVFTVWHDAPQLTVWHAGCSSGEETFSTAILLSEFQLLHKTSLVGSDINPYVIKKAQEACIAHHPFNSYLDSYYLAGGQKQLQDYVEDSGMCYRIKPSILKSCSFIEENILNTQYNNMFDLVMCRNTLIYFDLTLQNQLLSTIYTSMKPGAFLCLGEKESLRFTSVAKNFIELDPIYKIYQKRV